MNKTAENTQKFSVMATNDGRQGLMFHNAWKPDVVILDFGMEPLSGPDVAASIRKRDDERTLVIMISGHPAALRSRESGANLFFQKPFNAKSLFDMIVQWDQVKI